MINSDSRDKYVSRIMEMNQIDQLYLMGIIQSEEFGILETESTGIGSEIYYPYAQFWILIIRKPFFFF